MNVTKNPSHRFSSTLISWLWGRVRERFFSWPWALSTVIWLSFLWGWIPLPFSYSMETPGSCSPLIAKTKRSFSFPYNYGEIRENSVLNHSRSVPCSLLRGKSCTRVLQKEYVYGFLKGLWTKSLSSQDIFHRNLRLFTFSQPNPWSFHLKKVKGKCILLQP